MIQKRFIAAAVVMAAAFLFWTGASGRIVARSQPMQFVQISWQYPAGQSNVVFKLYTRTNLAAGPWGLVVTVPSDQRQITLIAQPGPHWFILTASNVVSRLESLPATTQSAP